jgi:hypothetical protein
MGYCKHLLHAHALLNEDSEYIIIDCRFKYKQNFIILNSALEKSFAQTDFKEAIAARGWSPLTQNLLDYPDIIATAGNLRDEIETASSSRQASSSSALSLNYNNGLASTVMAEFLLKIDCKSVC